MKKSLPKVKILLEGYASADSGGHSCSTIILVQTEKFNMIVDPGTTKNQQVLIDALAKESLAPEDVNIVYITHSHVDHYRNISMFKNAKVLDYFGWWESDVARDYRAGDLGSEFSLIETLGHSVDGTTLLVKTEKGKVAICGDVFWKENFPKRDPFAFDLAELGKSRKKVLKVADYIIPGHGKIFRVNK